MGIEGEEDLDRRRLTEKSREGECDWEEDEVEEEERRRWKLGLSDRNGEGSSNVVVRGNKSFKGRAELISTTTTYDGLRRFNSFW